MNLFAVLFALRCACACALSFAVANLLDLQQPLWAAMSAVIVSQERLGDTRAALYSRVAATALGAAVAVAAGKLGAAVGAPLTADLALGVGVTALVGHRWPSQRSAMWTSTLILVLSGSAAGLVGVALRRAAEFALGAVIAWGVHGLADLVEPREP